MPIITTTDSLTTTEVVPLSGPIKIVGENMVAGDEVIFYEETGTEGNYQALPPTGNRRVSLTHDDWSVIFEGYGNYKFLLGPDTNADLVVSYVAA